MTPMVVIQRILGTLRRDGGRALVRRITTRLFSSKLRRYRRTKAREDRLFDARLGLDTGGVQHAHGLPNAAVAIAHIASPPDDFAAALAAVDLPLSGLTFIDLGSGKGRAVILAAAYPFARVVGVEFAEPLHRVALANAARAGLAVGVRADFINADATRYALPDEPTLLFLFHPFGPPVLTTVARAAFASWRARPRPMRVVYLNPVHLQDWLDAGWREIARERRYAILAPPIDA